MAGGSEGAGGDVGGNEDDESKTDLAVRCLRQGEHAMGRLLGGALHRWLHIGRQLRPRQRAVGETNGGEFIGSR